MNLLILLHFLPLSILSADVVVVVDGSMIVDGPIISSSAVTMPSFGDGEGGGANKKKKKKNNNNNNNIIPAVFLFGDSLSDTGNGWFVEHRDAFVPPYGETFPGYPDGRFSDGRATVPDFLGITHKLLLDTDHEGMNASI